ncbi:MAG TPA: enoyl-CoA hydratase/isomerase family protein [Burkholderiaceae bacterium]|jgi:enoyl-CoA hydratase/carnithine racemase|nr:enoyl-CoA hydratase/isomerase family protein [Burkholderiaceae bacterium]
MTATAQFSQPTDGVGLILIDNGPRNFGTTELGLRIIDALQTAADAACRVVVIASDRPGYFIAHWSLQGIIDTQRAGPPAVSHRPRQPRVFDFIEASPMIVIAANNGQAWGGGAELSWGCDLRIAAESATYGQPEVALGIIPGAGGTTRLSRLIGPTKCMEMILDGRPITAREALALGAINKVVPDERLREESIAWAAHIARWPAWSLAACKHSLIDGRDIALDAARRSESAIFQSVARREDSIQLMAAAQARYDAGADSFEAIGIPRA